MKVGCGIDSKRVEQRQATLFQLPVLELEDCLYPGFLDQWTERLPRIQAALAGYRGEIIISGPYIDLNPGSPERLNIEITRERFQQAYAFARAVGAVEIIFLSTFIPIINLPSYDNDWVARSIAFWGTFMDSVDPGMVISLGNTFEFFPDYLIQIAQGVKRPNFRLALDLGHCLVYSKIDMEEWAGRVQNYCSTVYVHSNGGIIDTHDEPHKGVLGTSGYLDAAARHLSGDVRYLAKTNNKDTIVDSVRWIKRHVEH